MISVKGNDARVALSGSMAPHVGYMAVSNRYMTRSISLFEKIRRHYRNRTLTATYDRHVDGPPPEPGEPANTCLTLTAYEAADALGISRAFTYDGGARGEIPRVPSGRLGVAAEGALSMWSSRRGLGSCASRAGRSRGW
jgi:hypothetical protein